MTSVQEINQRVLFDRIAGPHWFQHYIASPYPPLSIIVGFRLFHDGFVSSLVQGDAMVHTLDVRLQCRVAWTQTSQVDLRLESKFLVLRRSLGRMTFTEVSQLYQTGELFCLLQHMMLEVPVIAELLERFVKLGVLLPFFQVIHLPCLLEALVQSSITQEE